MEGFVGKTERTELFLTNFINKVVNTGCFVCLIIHTSTTGCEWIYVQNLGDLFKGCWNAFDLILKDMWIVFAKFLQKKL